MHVYSTLSNQFAKCATGFAFQRHKFIPLLQSVTRLSCIYFIFKGGGVQCVEGEKKQLIVELLYLDLED